MLTLGIDSSTQGTKAVVYDTAAGRVVASAAVNYGKRRQPLAGTAAPSNVNGRVPWFTTTRVPSE